MRVGADRPGIEDHAAPRVDSRRGRDKGGRPQSRQSCTHRFTMAPASPHGVSSQVVLGGQSSIDSHGSRTLLQAVNGARQSLGSVVEQVQPDPSGQGATAQLRPQLSFDWHVVPLSH